MREIRRITGQKKYVFSIVLLFVVNICLFQYFQLETLQTLREPESGEMLRQLWQEEREAGKTDFYAKLSDLGEKVDSMLQISIFADEDSFSYKNILKTQKDFERLSDVEVAVENDRGVAAFLEYGESHGIAFIIIVIFVLAFFDERKAGLWQIVYTCKKGRLNLAWTRLCSLFAMSFITSFVITASTLLVSFFDYGGYGILGCSAQSVMALQNFTMPISVGGFLCYYYVISAVSLFVEGLFVWGMLSLVHNRSMGVIITVTVYGIESVLFLILTPQSPLCILKYLNLYFLLNPTGIFTDYINFPFGNLIFNQREFVHAVLAAAALVFAVGCLLVQMATRPFYVPGFLERKVEQLLSRLRMLLCHLNGIGYECYKFLIQGRGIMVIAVFSYIMFSNMPVGELLVSPGQELLNDFYEENTGEISAAMAEYEVVDGELKAAEAEWREAVSKGRPAEEEAMNKYESFSAERKMFRQLKKQVSYGKRLEKRGIRGWFINKKGFEKLFGEENTIRRLAGGMLASLALILILSPGFASEWQCGIGKILRCTPKGRETVFRRKYLCAAFFLAIIAGIVFATEIYGVLQNYPLRGLSAPVQNIPLLERFPFHWNIAVFLVVWFLCRLSVFAVISVLCLCVSVLSERVERTQFYCLLLLPLALLSGVSEYMLLGRGRTYKTCAAAVVLCIMMVGGVVCCRRAWVRGRLRK